VIQMAQMAPQIYDLPQLHRSMLDVLGIKNAEKLVPLPDDQKPTDPVSENQAALKGKPLKAFLFQNHQAHIAVHQSMMQDPMIMAIIGQNPQANQIMAALQAHMAEHAGFLYRQNIEEQLGMALPPEDEKMSPQLETALSGMMAQAAQQAAQQHQALAAQQQAQQQAQDPVLQMQQQELQIAQQEVQIKAQKLQLDAQLAQQKQMLEKAKAASESAVAMAKVQLEQEKIGGDLKLASMKVGAQIRADQHKIASQEQQAGLKAGIDIAKSKAQMNHEAQQNSMQVLKDIHENAANRANSLRQAALNRNQPKVKE
jgi:hypothetical protein